MQYARPHGVPLRMGERRAKIHQLSVDEAIRSLNSNAGGLSRVEAERRLQEYGPNRIEGVARRHPIWHLIREWVRLFSVILWMAAALAFIADRYAPGEGMARVAYAIIGVIVVSGLFSFWQEYRSEKTLAGGSERLLWKSLTVTTYLRVEDTNSVDRGPVDTVPPRGP